MTSRNLPKLTFTRPRFHTGEALTQQHRLDLLRRSVTDNHRDDDATDSTLRMRVAAVIMLLYAQPVTRIMTLTIDDIAIDEDGTVFLRLGDLPTPVPEPFAALVQRLLDQRPVDSTNRWLSPGRRPGQPLNYISLSQGLRDLGVPLRLARVAALRQLALQAPAPVIAEALGFHQTTTQRQTINAGASGTATPRPTRQHRQPGREYAAAEYATVPVCCCSLQCAVRGHVRAESSAARGYRRPDEPLPRGKRGAITGSSRSADQAARSVAHRRAGRDRHPGVRRLIQPPPPVRSLRHLPGTWRLMHTSSMQMPDRCAREEPGLRGVLLDFAGVLTCPIDDAHHAWCRNVRVPPDLLDGVLAAWQRLPAADNPIFLVETGAMSTASFERILGERLTAGGAPRIGTPGLVSRILRYFTPEPSMITAACALHAAGVRVGLVTNAWSDSRPWESFGLSLDAVVVSRGCGARKPDAAVYATAARELGLPPARCAFVDDSARNVNGAVQAGMLGVLHDAPTTTLAVLGAAFDDRYSSGRAAEVGADR